MQLDRILGDPGIDVAGEGLGGQGVAVCVGRPGSGPGDRLGNQGARCHQSDLVIGAAVLQGLKRTDRLSELLARLQIFQRDVEDRFGTADRVGCERQTHMLDQGVGDGARVSRQNPLGRQSNALEDHPPQMAGSIHKLDLLKAHTIYGGFDQNPAQRLTLLHRQEQDTRCRTVQQVVRDAVQHPAFSAVRRQGQGREESGGRERRDGADQLPCRQTWQPRGLLIRISTLDQGLDDQQRPEHRQGRDSSSEFFVHHRQLARTQPQAAVILGHRQSQPPQRLRRSPKRLVQRPLRIREGGDRLGRRLYRQHPTHAVAQSLQIHAAVGIGHRPLLRTERRW